MRVVIIGGGSLDMETAIRVIKRKKAYIIAADRGLDYCRLLHIMPNVAIGDFDSISSGTLELLTTFERQGIQIIRLNSDKDDTDLEAALGIALNMGKDGIDIIGATGTRVDHVLGNVGLLRRASERKVPAAIYDSHNRVRLISSGEKLTIKKNEQYGRFVSLFPLFGPCRGVNATGVHYPLYSAEIGNGEGCYTLTISNRIEEDEAVFSVAEGNLLIIESFG